MQKNIQTEINNLEIPNQGDLNVNKELLQHNSYRLYIPTK